MKHSAKRVGEKKKDLILLDEMGEEIIEEASRGADWAQRPWKRFAFGFIFLGAIAALVTWAPWKDDAPPGVQHVRNAMKQNQN